MSSRPAAKIKVQPPFRYRGRNTLQIAMPVGGIGAGNICVNGQGGFQDFSIRHKPFTTAIADDWNKPTSEKLYENAFGILHLPDLGITKLLEGQLPVEKIYDQGLQAQGFRRGNYEG